MHTFSGPLLHEESWVGEKHEIHPISSSEFFFLLPPSRFDSLGGPIHDHCSSRGGLGAGLAVNEDFFSLVPRNR